MKLKEGFNLNISNDEYHSDQSYDSSSTLKMALKDINDYYQQRILGNKRSFGNQGALDLGSYVHALILEPHVIKDEFIIYEGIMKEGEDWDLFLANNDTENKIIITKSQHDEAKKLLENFYKATIINEEGKGELVNNFFVGGDAEQSLCTTLNGLKIKVRFDYRKEIDQNGKVRGQISDVKTTSSAIRGKKDVEKVCKSWEYDLSAALYKDAVEKITGIPHDFYFCFISKQDRGTTFWKASDKMIERGRKKYKEAIRKLKKARKTNVWVECGVKEID